MRKLLLISALLIGTQAFASDLIINGAEFGIGKFHRKDNKVHPYEKNNAWRPFILPEGVSTKEAYIQKNSASNYTIFFTNLEEFLTKIVEISKTTGKKVSVLNLNAHGLPGGMWFPKDAKTRDSFECNDWRDAASNSDEANYDQYYSNVEKEEILSFNALSNARSIPGFQCLTGIKEWEVMVARVPAIKDVFTGNAQVHMLSCIVGMGTLGDAYTQGLANMLFNEKDSQQIQTSIKFGLGDWSMGEGMGFWGYESDEQLKKDNEIYPVHRSDREIMQKGSIRVAQVDRGQVKSGLISNQDFMLLEMDDRPATYKRAAVDLKTKLQVRSLPSSVRLPGTNVIIQVNQ